MFDQFKYGLKERTLVFRLHCFALASSLLTLRMRHWRACPQATVGGHIEMARRELPLDAAKRELLEETGLESPDWVFLGTYRTTANRGAGSCSCYLASNAHKAAAGAVSDEVERQQLLWMSESELRKAVLDGKFLEVKWSATVALALLRLES